MNQIFLCAVLFILGGCATVPKSTKFPEHKPLPSGLELVKITKPYKILVDPGHGGKDPGAIGRNGLKEKEIVLDVGRRLRDLLRERGFDVQMTRDQDVFISLDDRTEMAARGKVDLFISIHANSSRSSSAKGFEIYTVRPLSFAEKQEQQRKDNYQLLFQSLLMKRDDRRVSGIVEDLLGRQKPLESQRLAEALQQGVLSQGTIKDRGVQTAGFFVLRNTLVPAVLIELGFVTNSREEGLLRMPEYRQKLVAAIVDGVVRYVTVR